MINRLICLLKGHVWEDTKTHGIRRYSNGTEFKLFKLEKICTRCGKQKD